MEYNDYISNIVFSTDENYIIPTSIAIKSLIKNNINKIPLKIYILVEKKLSDNLENILNNLVINTNSKIFYISVGDFCSDTKMNINHITKATYYRLLLPKLLINVKQCLYLDGDICINSDITELLKIKLLENEFVAGVKAPGIQLRIRNRKKRLKLLEIDSLDSYINAGVIIFNLDAIRKNNLYDKMIFLVDKNFPVQDQDVINVACYNHIKIIHPKFNSMPQIYEMPQFILKKIYNKKEILEARQKPIIIHYANKYKPWKYKLVKMSKIWYDYYEKMYSVDNLYLKNYRLHKFKDFIIEKLK